MKVKPVVLGRIGTGGPKDLEPDRNPEDSQMCNDDNGHLMQINDYMDIVDRCLRGNGVISWILSFTPNCLTTTQCISSVTTTCRIQMACLLRTACSLEMENRLKMVKSVRWEVKHHSNSYVHIFTGCLFEHLLPYCEKSRNSINLTCLQTDYLLAGTAQDMASCRSSV
jgi:hypothetical protein